ncbi:PREDICTED: BCL2/adenovirus E1B 19 kDa protein-interacting protein 3-like [Priapulus caudatus]|uniref:BCL2/adenovirus E1B 19 kDa protein-interacting protein 3-like n=1 Tax=Priapulus caudatus TaxID=37621 RepID=A0ABM1ELR0_PRICU|nr:PREDICTED: BCL2/adenovirus E1B 19 kDa protein-interacting protein 3-like [Priapulus caudatus]
MSSLQTHSQESPSGLNESWVELDAAPGGMVRVSSIHDDEGTMEKLLIEAQRESNQSSAIGSKSNSKGNSPRGVQTPASISPKGLQSPSSGSELAGDFNGLSSRIINEDLKANTDWIWDWSSRPEPMPPKEFKFRRPPQKAPLSIRNTKAMKTGFTELIPLLIISNLMSLVLGAGIGWFFAKKMASSGLTAIPMPLD